MTIKWENYIFRHVLNVFQKKKRLVVAAVVFAERNPTVLVEIESVISYSVELPCYPCIACSCRVQTWELGGGTLISLVLIEVNFFHHQYQQNVFTPNLLMDDLT